MKNIILLPADSYVVISKTVLSRNDTNVISMLYEPIIGYTAVALFYTLFDDLDKYSMMGEEYTHHHIMSVMGISMDDFVEARKKLEGVGLLKTYYKEEKDINHYVYLLYSPVSSYEFFHHPILNVVLYNNLGKEEYNKLLDYFKVPRVSLKDYSDITESFSSVFKTVPGTLEVNEKIAKRTTGNINISSNIDFDFLIESIPKNMYSDKCFNDDVKNLINTLSYTYSLDTEALISIVRDSIDEKGMIDKNYLRRSARNFYQFRNEGQLPTIIYSTQPEYLKKPAGDKSNWAKMVYTFENTSPYRFLKAKSGGAAPTSRDLNIIESLLIDQKLKPGVVNVLLSYVLKVNNGRLNKSYIESIAGEWKRLKVETVEDAMKRCEKEYKKRKKSMKSGPTKKKESFESIPVWLDKENKEDAASESDKEEMDDILNTLV